MSIVFYRSETLVHTMEDTTMKRLLLTIPLLLSLAITDSSEAQYYGDPQARVRYDGGFGNVGFFYRPLLQHGEWIELEPGFYGWRPHRTSFGWRPYRYGHWAWSNHGWYWISREPYGWAVYHYGRWFYDEYYGWIWIPDDVWGPAWVEWRYDDDYIGWAPLGPYATFHVSVGIHYTMGWNAPYNYWCFVRHGHFTKTNYNHYMVSTSTTRRLIKTTRSAGSYSIDRGTVFNHGPERSFIEGRGRVRIESYDVSRTTSGHENVIRSEGVRRIESYRPESAPQRTGSERIDARKATRSSGLQMERIERSRSQDPGVQRQNGRETIPPRTEPAIREDSRNDTKKTNVPQQPQQRTRKPEEKQKKDQGEVRPATEARRPAAASSSRSPESSRSVARESSTISQPVERSPRNSTGTTVPPTTSKKQERKRNR